MTEKEEVAEAVAAFRDLLDKMETEDAGSWFALGHEAEIRRARAALTALEANPSTGLRQTMFYTAKESWAMTDTEKVVAVIKEAEFWRLGDTDGCPCCRFSIRYVDIEIRCYKHGRSIAVETGSMSFPKRADLEPIMDEVSRQLMDYTDSDCADFDRRIIPPA